MHCQSRRLMVSGLKVMNRYTGTELRSYMDYVNNATGQMLVAEPGGSYDIRATWDALPVPPADGFWLVGRAGDAGDDDEGGDAEGEGSLKEEKKAAKPVTTAPEE
jgi:hypothetical protein